MARVPYNNPDSPFAAGTSISWPRNHHETTHWVRFGFVKFRSRLHMQYNDGPDISNFDFDTSMDNKGSVYMYMPDSLQMAYGPVWDWKDFPLLGPTIQLGRQVGGGESASEMLGAAAKAAWVGTKMAFKSLDDESASLLSKTAMNPYKNVLFKGIEPRQFSFAFTFNPKNADDCMTIMKIVDQFKYHSAPEFLDASAALWDFPEEFTIDFYSDGKVNNWVPKIGFCICNGVQTDFTSAGMWSALKNNAPVEQTMTVNFTEVELVTKTKVREGY